VREIWAVSAFLVLNQERKPGMGEDVDVYVCLGFPLPSASACLLLSGTEQQFPSLQEVICTRYDRYKYLDGTSVNSMCMVAGKTFP
jgi:hypothetical protein